MPDPVIVFRDDIGTYSGKGSPLTKGEVDTNFHELLLAIIALQAVSGNFIDEVTYTSATFTVHLTGGGSVTIPLPTALFNPRGAWTNNETYFVNDVVSVDTLGTFVANQEHTAPASPEVFDPSAETTDGLLWTQIGGAFTRAFPVHTREDETFTPEIADGNTYNVITSETGCVVEIAANADIPHEVGTEVDIHADTDGLVSITGAVGVTIKPPRPGIVDLILPFNGSTIKLKKVDENIWHYIGDVPFSPVFVISDTEYEISREDVGRYLVFEFGCIVTFTDLSDVPPDAEIHFRQGGDDPVSFFEGGTSVIVNPQRDGYDTSTPWKGATITAKWRGSDEWDLIGPHGDELTV